MEVDLVLARRDFVVRGLDVHAHLLEGDDDFAPHVLAQVHGRQVEVAGGVVGVGGGLPSRRRNRKNSVSGPAIIVKPSLRRERDRALQAWSADSRQRACRPGWRCRR